jgi:hypothetical protein
MNTPPPMSPRPARHSARRTRSLGQRMPESAGGHDRAAVPAGGRVVVVCAPAVQRKTDRAHRAGENRSRWSWNGRSNWWNTPRPPAEGEEPNPAKLPGDGATPQNREIVLTEREIKRHAQPQRGRGQAHEDLSGKGPHPRGRELRVAQGRAVHRWKDHPARGRAGREDRRGERADQPDLAQGGRDPGAQRVDQTTCATRTWRNNCSAAPRA